MKKVLLLGGDYAEDYEVMLPFQILQYAGYEPVCVAPERKSGEKIRTAIHDFLGDATYRETEGHQFLLNGDFDTLDPSEFAGLYLTGGRAPEYLRLNERVLEIVRYFFKTEKPVAAICHGIQILTAADVVRGRVMTCYPAVAPEVRSAGGIYIEMPADKSIIDRNLATSPAWPGVANLMQCFTGLMEKSGSTSGLGITGSTVYNLSCSDGNRVYDFSCDKVVQAGENPKRFVISIDKNSACCTLIRDTRMLKLSVPGADGAKSPVLLKVEMYSDFGEYIIFRCCEEES
ncbi:MAG: DJ-1/PfpI family protein [Lachnospiraceae bacterium]|nr:DJ-1/PfpI family protein [Lachnospiraceae bacterium]